MFLLSKDEFLSWSLTPVRNTMGLDDCSIHHDPLLRPVRTPCGHVYCSYCLTSWLESHNTCPTCREQLFGPEVNSDPGEDNFQQNDFDANSPNHNNLDVGDSDQDNVDWPEDIESFDLSIFSVDRDWHDLPAKIEDFDTYQNELNAYGTHPLIDTPSAGQEVHVDVSSLIVEAVAGMSRLSTNQGLDRNDLEGMHIHALCRLKWKIVVFQLENTLSLLAEREESRRGSEWAGTTAGELYSELRAALSDLPSAIGHEHSAEPHVRDMMLRKPEAVRFRDDVDVLIRWVVTQAAREYATSSNRARGCYYFDQQDWWLGVLDR